VDKKGRRAPRQERALATVEVLLTATAQVLVEEGYAKASTNKIARRAGVSVGSLYQYFSDKDALVNALLEQWVERQLALLEETLVALREADAEATVRAVLVGMIQIKQHSPELTRVLYEQIPRTGQFDQVERWNRRAAQLLEGHLEARRAQVRPQALGQVAWLLVQIFHGVINHAALYQPGLLQEAWLVEELTELVLRYLRPDPSPGAAAPR
jgi:AcrR family transcriptional regulator